MKTSLVDTTFQQLMHDMEQEYGVLTQQLPEKCKSMMCHVIYVVVMSLSHMQINMIYMVMT